MDTLKLLNKEDVFNELVKNILECHLQPEDFYEIAALLESMGWNDERVARVLGYEDIFELAAAIWDSVQKNMSYTPFSKVEKPAFKEVLIEIVQSFLRGVIFALPMAISVASMLMLKFSLWAYENLTVEQATSIAIGTILSFITVGGFTQAIARRGFFYIIQGYYLLARKNTFNFIKLGFLVCAVLSLLILVFNLIFSLFPYIMLIYIVLYFFFLSSIWLTVTAMYILKKELAFSGLIIFGILIVFVLFRMFNFDIIFAQIIALLIVSVLGIIFVFYFFSKAQKKLERAISLKLPRISITIYSILPYFLYGFLYFTFLFVDRVNAWSTNEAYMPYVIWFRGNYELGLDFALLILIIPMGVSEVIVSRLMLELEASQKGYLGIYSNKMKQKFLTMYYKMMGVILVSAVISAILIWKLTLWYNEISLKLNDNALLDSEITRFVLFWGDLSYVILAIFLMNAVILFSLSQARLVNRAVVPALLLNMISGFLLTRWIHYEFAVFGLLIGSLVMMGLSVYYVIKVLKNLDYYLYAAS